MLITASYQTATPLTVKAEAFDAQKSARVFLWAAGVNGHVMLTIEEAEMLMADLAPAIEHAKRIEALAKEAA